MRSLGRSLAFGTILGSAAVLLAGGAAIYLLVRAGLVRHLDRGLADKAVLISSAVEQGSRGVRTEFDDLNMRGFMEPGGPAYLQFWLDDDTELYRSRSLGKGRLEKIVPAGAVPGYRWVTLPSGRTGRAVGITFLPHVDLVDDNDPVEPERTDKRIDDDDAIPHDAHLDWLGRPPSHNVTMVLAWDASSTKQAMAVLGIVLACVGLAVIAVTAGSLWVVVRRSLRPLDRLAARIGGLDETDLSAKIGDDDALRELEPVRNRLNDLLGRLDGAFRRERSFSADVAHELRTPLAGLRSIIEVGLSRVRSGEEHRDTLEGSLQITCQMQSMVENLLSLARLEAGRVTAQKEPVFPNELIRECWKPLRETAEGRGLNVEWILGPEVPVIADSVLLGLVIRNILDNAVFHADHAGSVKIETVAGDGVVEIRVANSGSTLSPDEVEHVFERLWRGGKARSDTGIHCGLGLSLARGIVALLGGSVTARSDRGGIFEIVVSIADRMPEDEDAGE